MEMVGGLIWLTLDPSLFSSQEKESSFIVTNPKHFAFRSMFSFHCLTISLLVKEGEKGMNEIVGYNYIYLFIRLLNWFLEN